MKSFTRSTIFFVAGIAIGAVAGILMAPEKGSVTREKLRNRARDLSDNFSESYDNMKEEFRNMKDKMRSDRNKRAEVNPE